MAPRLALAVAALALLLPGCSDAPVNESAVSPPAADAPFWLEWNLADCRELAVFFEARPEAVRPFFPPGFEPGPGATPATTTVGMDAFRCASGSGVDGELADVSYASFWAVAVPPEALRGEVEQWFVKWMATSDDEVALVRLQDLGAPVHAGDVRYADALPVPVVGSTIATIDIDGLGTATITLGPESPPQAAPGGGTPLREFTASADGSLLVWEATLTRPEQSLSAGVLSVPPGSVLAAIPGTAQIPVVVADGVGGGLSGGSIVRA